MLAARIRKNVVVVELGSVYVRAGYAGEATPRCVWASPTHNLEEWFVDLFARGLLAAKASQLRVVVLESPTVARQWRDARIEALVAAGPPEALAFAPTSVAAAAALARATALVLDVGASECRAIAVCDGYAVRHSLCVGDDLAALVLTCLDRCALDTRRRLAANLAPAGGRAMTPGFDARLCADLRALAPGLDFRIAHADFPRSDLAWTGGSILAAAALVDHRFDGLDPAHPPPDIFAIGSPLVAGIRLDPPIER
ncbi:hypothetical protein CTAYLR_002234 [Chrysophaeum taylorii]|uniref:Uncharacterized protein n=1 Tax=Chrysophaeum taylorii TaxID=2483200 RepID=A0AAD7UNG8_9STRA|nr:hypothetical protein CTAYLR_002234 [Chrysophaeum taylorii]